MKIVVIDTSSNEQIRVGIKIKGKVHWEISKVNTKSSQIVLPLIDKLLKKHKLSLKDIGSIQVHTGPGSFTGLRVGVAIANALSFALKVPINNKKIGESEHPVYQ